jgi:uncharacterized protein YecA (UPF0149 family)
MTDYRSLSADELWTALGQSYRTADLDLICACLEQREELTPALLKALEDGPDLDWEHDDPRWFLEIHAGLLLCAYREPAALEVFAQVFRDPDRDNVFEWFTYDLSTAYGLAALPMLLELMNDDDAYPYARSATMAMLVVIAQNHPDEHDRIVASLQSLLPILTENGELPPDTKDSELWTWIALSLADLKDETGLPQIMALYQGGMIDEWAIGNQEKYLEYLNQQVDVQPRHYDVLEVYEKFHQQAARQAEKEAKATEQEELSRLQTEKARLEAELSEHQAERERLEAELAERLVERKHLEVKQERLLSERERLQGEQPAAALARPKIGRNDPCWCGSGKKYKRCHWREDRRQR